ncbi:pyrroline-5-carboxylate reductase [Neomegalonema sp.]|uniref:pyrroline-5-carboxylate reductase n=1 Tax=Neomegalonema sp. TaxID=2039713 RepID=UPI0026349381|nr:pyrroline-5-carboxylate reductase [Neomegalonema sp.]MDD2867569.1 pyrroline-5-carboxylate reductase [Neomegalonema sp.]
MTAKKTLDGRLAGRSVALLGCGKMGGALLEGWIRAGLDPARAVIYEAHVSPAVERFAALGAQVNPAQPPQDSAAVLLAVKPQSLDEALPGVAPLLGPGRLALSIAAGKTLDWLAARLPAGTPLVRAMPNTPAAIGRGISALIANAAADDAERGLAEALMAAAGETLWLPSEDLMDAVTAVSGSGPAYVFHMAEALAAAGESAGLPAELSLRLARATVSGAGALLDAESGQTAAELRAAVTSKGGTTAAALEHLMRAESGLSSLMTQAVSAAAARSRELSS